MDIIEMTRELGKAIQADERYIAYCLAKQANDEDEQLQNLIKSFNLKRVELQMEISNPEKDNDKVQELNHLIKDIYKKIMSDPKMTAYNNAKTAVDELMSQVNSIITMSANGINPDEIDVDNLSCVGDCGSCGGCG